MTTEQNKPVILETIILRFEVDVACISPNCPNGNVINAGTDALVSPSSRVHFYHIDCFKELIKERGKDPDQYLKIIDIGGPPKTD